MSRLIRLKPVRLAGTAGKQEIVVLGCRQHDHRYDKSGI